MTTELSTLYEQVWLVDFEYSTGPSGAEQPRPICMVARDVLNGDVVHEWLWDSPLARCPISLDERSLYVAYYAAAEINCHLALGWQIPLRILDLYVEFRCVSNGKRRSRSDWEKQALKESERHSLLACMFAHGLRPSGSEVQQKEEMRQFFNEAVESGYAKSNPFEKLPGTTRGNEKRQFFVTPDAIETCMEHCPELRPYLEKAWDAAADGAEFVVNRYRQADQNLRETFLKILARAGISPWPRLFQNLRASRETELMARFPAKDVAAWLGNSVPVAMRHYAMATDESFIRASIPDGQTVSRSTRSEAAGGCIGGCTSEGSGAISQDRENNKASVFSGKTEALIVQDSCGNYYLMGDTGLENPAKSPENRQLSADVVLQVVLSELQKLSPSGREWVISQLQPSPSRDI